MTDRTPMDSNNNDEIDDVGELIRMTGGREPIAEAQFDAAHARVGAHWQTVIAARRQQRRSGRLRLFAVAAGFVAAVSIALFVVTGVPAPETAVASVDHVVGDVFADGKALRPGDTIARTSVIETGPSARIAIELNDGQSLRLDMDTRVGMRDLDRIELEQGAVYIATAAIGDPSPVYVETPFGVASDIGTRFQVRIDEQQLSVGVRDGIVEVNLKDSDPVSIAGGRQYLLSADGEAREQTLDENSLYWDWADSVRPPFDIDGATLIDYLTWYAREQGLTLHFADERSEQIARATLLSGSIEGLSIEEGLQLVRRIAPFAFESELQLMTVGIE